MHVVVAMGMELRRLLTENLRNCERLMDLNQKTSSSNSTQPTISARHTEKFWKQIIRMQSSSSASESTMSAGIKALDGHTTASKINVAMCIMAT